MRKRPASKKAAEYPVKKDETTPSVTPPDTAPKREHDPKHEKKEEPRWAWFVKQMIIVAVVWLVGTEVDRTWERVSAARNPNSLAQFRAVDRKVHDSVVGVQAHHLGTIFYGHLDNEYAWRTTFYLGETRESLYRRYDCTQPLPASDTDITPRKTVTAPPPVAAPPAPPSASVQDDPLYKKLHAQLYGEQQKQTPPTGMGESPAFQKAIKELDNTPPVELSANNFGVGSNVVPEPETPNCQAADAEFSQVHSGGNHWDWIGLGASLIHTIGYTARRVWKMGGLSVAVALVSTVTAAMLVFGVRVKGEMSNGVTAYWSLLARVLVIPFLASLIAYLISLPMWLGAYLLHSYVNAPMTVGFFCGVSSPVAIFLGGLSGRVTEHHTSHFFIDKAEHLLERLIKRRAGE